MVIQVYVSIVHNTVYCLCEFSKDQILAKISFLFLKLTYQPKKEMPLTIIFKTKKITHFFQRETTMFF